MLPKQTYYIFIDNPFSSPNLFHALREAGHGAIGTACPNYSITKELKVAKGKDKAGASGFKYNKVTQIARKDNSLVLFLSTIYSGADN
ncbi:Leptomycin B resistance protein pmd1 [Fusarium oxysporum f. sp. albedinis]|nr:Leptomycin B resistance protein pmd1 [Fusarium oxysporum f. sp. albedinis]